MRRPERTVGTAEALQAQGDALLLFDHIKPKMVTRITMIPKKIC